MFEISYRSLHIFSKSWYLETDEVFYNTIYLCLYYFL